MDKISAFIIAAGKVLDNIKTAGEKTVKIIDLTGKVIQNGNATDADWAALHAYEAAETDILDAPMDGET